MVTDDGGEKILYFPKLIARRFFLLSIACCLELPLLAAVDVCDVSGFGWKKFLTSFCLTAAAMAAAGGACCGRTFTSFWLLFAFVAFREA